MCDAKLRYYVLDESEGLWAVGETGLQANGKVREKRCDLKTGHVPPHQVLLDDPKIEGHMKLVEFP